jgi:hypothetical protein
MSSPFLTLLYSGRYERGEVYTWCSPRLLLSVSLPASHAVDTRVDDTDKMRQVIMRASGAQRVQEGIGGLWQEPHKQSTTKTKVRSCFCRLSISTIMLTHYPTIRLFPTEAGPIIRNPENKKWLTLLGSFSVG